jgi:mRNA interferase MazF
MGEFVKGDLIVVPFPFSDLTANKRRPALVVASMIGDDVILCQITSKSVRDTYAISLTESDLKTGKFHQDSNIRPNRLFTADSNIILYRIGTLTPEKHSEVVSKIIELIS